MKRKVQHFAGSYIVNGRFINVDYDYPRTAESIGWSIRRVQKINGETKHLARYSNRCMHFNTDGTVNCPNCEVTASEFISAAAEYLDKFC